MTPQQYTQAGRNTSRLAAQNIFEELFASVQRQSEKKNIFLFTLALYELVGEDSGFVRILTPCRSLRRNDAEKSTARCRRVLSRNLWRGINKLSFCLTPRAGKNCSEAFASVTIRKKDKENAKSFLRFPYRYC